MKKSLDRTFLNYGIRQEDMQLIESACQSEGIDAEWLKDYILKPFHMKSVITKMSQVLRKRR